MVQVRFTADAVMRQRGNLTPSPQPERVSPADLLNAGPGYPRLYVV